MQTRFGFDRGMMRAISRLARLGSRASSSSWARASEATHEDLLNVLRARSPRRDEVHAAIDEMRARGTLQTQRHFTLAIAALGQVRSADAAGALLGEMRAAELAPNDITFSALITAYGAAGDWQRALALLRSMRLGELGEFG